MSLFAPGPGRDTQDCSWSINFCRSFCASFFGPALFDCVTRLVAFVSGQVVVVLLLFVGFFAQVCLSPVQRFERKHGRWRFKSFFPVAFLLLSMVTVSQAVAPVFQPLCMPFQASPSRSPTMACLMNQWLKAFDRPRDFDSVLRQIEEDDQPCMDPFSDFNCASAWEEHLAHEAFSRRVCGEIPFDDIDLSKKGEPGLQNGRLEDPPDDSSHSGVSASSSAPSLSPAVGSSDSVESIVDLLEAQITSQSQLRIDSVPESVSVELQEALLDLENAQVHLCPARLSSVSKVDLASISGLIRPSATSAVASHDFFPVLLDAGCSVAASGFPEDFHGQLACGHFGAIKTADGMATIKGFGVAHWQVLDRNGNPALIRVPCCFVPAVEMRLLSPQDCA